MVGAMKWVGGGSYVLDSLLTARGGLAKRVPPHGIKIRSIPSFIIYGHLPWWGGNIVNSVCFDFEVPLMHYLLYVLHNAAFPNVGMINQCFC